MTKTPRKSRNAKIARGKEARSDPAIAPSDHLTIVWKLSKIDWDGPWGHSACSGLDFLSFVKGTLSYWETMTWAEIYRACGGRAGGNNNHPVKVEDISPRAKRRLQEINQDDIEEIISLRIQGCERVYGIRDSRALQILWYDPWHGDVSRAVCPSAKKHT